MMLVTVNGEELGGQVGALRTLGEALDIAATMVDPRDVVTRVVIDGQVCDPTDEALRSRNVQRAGRVAIDTQSPEAFAATKLAELADHLDAIVAKLELAERCFSVSADAADANAVLAAATEELRLLLVLEQHLELLPGARGPRPPSKRISEAARELVEAERRRDWEGVAGLVREELRPALETWREQLRGGQERPE